MEGVWRESGEEINSTAVKRVESSVKDGAVNRKKSKIATYGAMLTRLRPDVHLLR